LVKVTAIKPSKSRQSSITTSIWNHLNHRFFQNRSTF